MGVASRLQPSPPMAGAGQNDAASKLVGAVYGWFTEGFDTPDLRDAKALFDELESVG